MYESPEEIIRRQLGASEQMKWAGAPRQGLALRPADALMIPFSVLWGGFAIFWETIVITNGAPGFFVLWGVPFVLFGLYFMFGRFWVDARQRATTTYGITSERVIIMSGLLSSNVKSLNLDTLTDVSLTERPNGAGTITFGSTPLMFWWHSSLGWPGLGPQTVPAFELPERARDVYEIIRAAQRASKHRT